MAGFYLTHKMLVQLYELLVVSPPFSGWHLPKAEDIVFEATTISRPGRDGIQATYHYENGKHIIRINPERHKTLASALMTLAHELIHMYLQIKHPRDRAHHGRRFERLARIVCNIQGFDKGQF